MGAPAADGDESVIRWMFESTRDDFEMPVAVDAEKGGRRRMQERSRRRAERGRRRPSLAAVTAVVLAAAMFAHELLKKSLSNALVLVMLVIYTVTLLAFAMGQCERRIKPSVSRSLFLMGFGPAFMLLIFVTALCFITMLAYYCWGANCADLDKVSVLKAVPALLKESPIRGILFATLVSFVNAALLEETIKLVFVSNSIESVSTVRSVRPELAGALPAAPLAAANLGTLAAARGAADGSDEADDLGSGARGDARVYRPDPTLELIEVDRSVAVTGRHGIVMYFVSFTLGLALAESMLFVCCFSRNPNEAVRISLFRMFFSIPMHVACGCLTAIGLVERYIHGNKSLCSVLLPSVLFHGAFDFFHVVPVADFIDPDAAYTVKHALSVAVLGVAAFVLWRRFSKHHITF